MNYVEVLEKCRTLAKDDPSLDQDIRELIDNGLQSDADYDNEEIEILEDKLQQVRDELADSEDARRKLVRELAVLEREVKVQDREIEQLKRELQIKAGVPA